MDACARLFAFPTLFLLFLGGCRKPIDFTGFWKANCTDAFGVQIKKQTTNLFSVSFCGPGGCFAPGEWMPNTAIVGDPHYRVINATTIEIGQEKGWTRYMRCTTDTNPKLDYSTMMPKESQANGSPVAQSTPSATPNSDVHRPPCTTASCRKIAAFLKKNYCGDSPYGNGPDNGCAIQPPKAPSAKVNVVADYKCEWIENKNETECKQTGKVDAKLRDILFLQLQKSGLPADAPGETYFTVWQPHGADWFLAQADYSHRIGDDVELCEVIAIVKASQRVTVLRKLPFTKTDSDVPESTDWSLLGFADTRGNGHLDVILLGEAYEDHWFEVISLENGSPETIFSGLGYYL